MSFFDFPVQFEIEKKQPTNLYKNSIYNKNTIDI